jgi:hypothetical protein
MGSIIAILLKWTGLSQGAMELTAIGIVVSAVGGFAAYEHHKIYTEGVKTEVAKVQKQDARDAAILTQRAKKAEDQHVQDDKDLAAYRASTPVEPVRLRILTPANHVSAAGAQCVGSSAAPATGSVLEVPAGDSGSGTGQAGQDIGGLLEALAARADQVTNQARELQSR